jgi:hypothetical protein
MLEILDDWNKKVGKKEALLIDASGSREEVHERVKSIIMTLF